MFTLRSSDGDCFLNYYARSLAPILQSKYSFERYFKCIKLHFFEFFEAFKILFRVIHFLRIYDITLHSIISL